MRQLIAKQRDQLAYHEAQIEKIKQGLKELEALLEELQEETGEEQEGADESAPNANAPHLEDEASLER